MYIYLDKFELQPTAFKMINYSSKIVRALRKYFEITQNNFASIISVSQSALSKIEADKLELSALQWVIICDKFNIAPNSLFTGKIEQLGDSKIELKNYSSIGNFKIPNKYGFLAGSTVRSAYPLIKYMNLKLGEKKANEFLKSLGFDPDYFIIMNNPLNLIFVQDLYQFLISQNVLSSDDISKIIQVVDFKDAHSSIIDELSNSQNFLAATKKLIHRVSSNYELNTDYKFVGSDDEFVVAKDRAHVSEFNLSSNFNNFRQNYNVSHFESLSILVGTKDQNLTFKSKATSDGWIITR